jgi:serine/threonine protein kinase
MSPVAVFPRLVLLVLLAIVLITVFFLVRSRLRRRGARIMHAVMQSSCPSPAGLKAFLDGKTPDKEIANHVETCERCQDRMELLLAGKEPWPVVPRNPGGAPATQDLALKRAIENLKASTFREASPDAVPPSSSEGLDFLSPSDQPGHLGRLGHYEILEVIGRGGMGVVLKGFDPALHRIVAIKVLAPQLATSGTARKRFTREAQAAAAVCHEHVVTIHAVSEANGLPYLVMHYVAGMSLQERLDKSGPLDLKEILRIGMQTASGLAAAHAQGLVHRDIKPANILLENGVQRVKISDFGLARAADDASLTQSGVVAGTPQYMAPEQTRGEVVDHMADLFSLGSVLYAMCTGRPPFCASTAMGVLRRVSDDTPRSIKELNPEIPDWLVAIVDKLHAKDPADRFQSANEVAELLNQHLAQLQQASWTPMPAAPTAKAPARAAGTDGPITSLTICPLCGSHLHVPDKLVGSIVNCPQCGKPFQVEDTSQEIQVIQARPPRGFPSPKPARKIPLSAWISVGLVVLFVFVCGGLGLVMVGRLSVRPEMGATVATEAPWPAPLPDEAPPPRSRPESAQLTAKLDAALAIRNVGQRDDALFVLAQEAAAEDVSVMQAALRGIRSNAQRDGAAEACVFRLVAAGKHSLAFAVAKEISNPGRRQEILKKLASGELDSRSGSVP